MSTSGVLGLGLIGIGGVFAYFHDNFTGMVFASVCLIVGLLVIVPSEVQGLLSKPHGASSNSTGRKQAQIVVLVKGEVHAFPQRDGKFQEIQDPNQTDLEFEVFINCWLLLAAVRKTQEFLRSVWRKVETNPEQMPRIRTAWSQPMKYMLYLVAAAVVGLMGCGAGHANLTSITVSPQSATTTSNPQGQVGYTATGNFANGKSRELLQVDGLSWKTSPTSTGTAAATIGSTGEATCSAPGNVTVTASAPENLQFTVNNGVQNTSATISGTATLTCQ